MTEGTLSAHELKILTKKVRAILHDIIVENEPISIEEVYERIERSDECAPWRRHYWESSKWAVQSEWKHKIRTYLQARDRGKKIYIFVKGKGWMRVETAKKLEG